MRLDTNDSAEQTAPFEAELINRAQKGDEQAFREIVERYQDGVFALTAAIAGSPSAADHIAQQVFVKLYRSLPSAGFRPSLAAWVYRSAVSESFDYFRKHHGRDRADGPEEGRVSIVRLLATLPEEERDLLILSEVQGRSVAELARLTNRSVEAVSTALFRTRQKLLKAAKSTGMFTLRADGSPTRPER